MPFAGGFALLAEPLRWMNEVKTTPVDALQALGAKAPGVRGAEMNPGDVWDSRDGFTRRHPPVEWGRRLATIEDMQRAHAAELRDIEAEEQKGPPDLYDRFEARLTQNRRRVAILGRRLDCSVLFDVEGQPGGHWEVDLRQGRRGFRQGDSGDWLLRVTIPAALLAEVLTDPDGWETLGISYKLKVYLKKGARAKEGLLTRLIHTPSPLSLVRWLCTPRFAEFVVRRRHEFLGLARETFLGAA